jgi:methionyl-tRNA formyltransferase
VPLVVTVADDPHENRWYASVAETARDYGLTVITPPDAAGAELARHLTDLAPDFLFSFYYRSMLPATLLAGARRGALNMHGSLLPHYRGRAPVNWAILKGDGARRGALNMHGSLLPHYRGRAPVNWAILKGERETGATLHYMVERADAGDIVDQLAVPILEDDDAREVMAKVTVAAEVILARSLPLLLAGQAPRRPQALLPGAYFGRRRPEDGRIDWRSSAAEIHNLVRAVAPPFPGAFTEVNHERYGIYRTRRTGERRPLSPQLYAEDGRCFLVCGDGGVLELLAAADARGALDLAALAARAARAPLPLS